MLISKMKHFIRVRLGEFFAAYVAAFTGITLVRTLGIYEALQKQSSILELLIHFLASAAFGLVFGVVGALGIFLANLVVDLALVKCPGASKSIPIGFYAVCGVVLALLGEKLLEGRISYGVVTLQYVVSGVVAAAVFTRLLRAYK
jgi:hypothetical protein